MKNTHLDVCLKLINIENMFQYFILEYTGCFDLFQYTLIGWYDNKNDILELGHKMFLMYSTHLILF